MDNSTRNFINNINKSNQKPIEFIDAFQSNKELNIKPSVVWWVIGLTFGICYIWYRVVVA